MVLWFYLEGKILYLLETGTKIFRDKMMWYLGFVSNMRRVGGSIDKQYGKYCGSEYSK